MGFLRNAYFAFYVPRKRFDYTVAAKFLLILNTSIVKAKELLTIVKLE